MIMNSLHRKLYLTLLCCAPLLVTACGSSGSGGTTTTNDTPPLAPSGINASPGDGVVDVSWNPVSGATAYNLYWSTSSGVTKQNGTRIAGVSSPHSLAGLTNGTPYYFIVSAENTMGEGAASAEASATPQISPPEQVTGLNVTPLVQGAQLGWNAVTGADSYNLYWSTSTGVTPQTGTRISGVTSPHIVSSLTAGMAHYFVVTAVNAGGEGTASAEVSATPGAPVAGWSTQELINTPFDFFDTDHYVGDVDINDNGAAAAVWVEEGSDRDTARVMVNRFSNGLWGLPEILAGPSAFSPRTVVAPNGDVTVSYLLRGFNPDNSWLNATVWVRRYSSGAWSAPQQIDGIDLATFTFMHGMDIAVDATGNVVVGWIQDNSVIWANRYDVVSDSWGTATVQSNSIRLVQEPALGADGQGNFTIVWLQDTKPYDPGQTAGGPSNPTLYASRYTGVGWTAAVPVGHADIQDWESAERVDLAVNADGAAVAVWEQTRNATGGGTDWSVDTVRYDPLTGNWGTPAAIYSQSIYTSWPDVAIDAAGNAIVTWQPTDPVDSSQRIASASFYDATLNAWSPAETINTDDGVSDVDELRVGKDAAGNAIAVWIQGGELKARHFEVLAGAWSIITPIGLRDGTELEFAVSSTGRAAVITNPMDISGVPWMREIRANIFTP
jgi:hypothetical protein